MILIVCNQVQESRIPGREAERQDRQSMREREREKWMECVFFGGAAEHRRVVILSKGVWHNYIQSSKGNTTPNSKAERREKGRAVLA